MHPLLKRTLLNGVPTAALLAGVGLLLTHFAGMLAPGPAAKPAAPDVSGTVAESLRGTVPLMMALWGFAFVAVCEAVRWCLWGRLAAVAKPAGPQADTAEQLLNELLAQADAKMAAEASADPASSPSPTRG